MLNIVEPVREALHGHFSRDLLPVLTIEPGDTVRFRTLPGGWNLEPRQSTRYADYPRAFAPRDPVLDDGHALCGPIAIRGALPGMALGVRSEVVRAGGSLQAIILCRGGRCAAARPVLPGWAVSVRRLRGGLKHLGCGLPITTAARSMVSRLTIIQR